MQPVSSEKVESLFTILKEWFGSIDTVHMPNRAVEHEIIVCPSHSSSSNLITICIFLVNGWGGGKITQFMSNMQNIHKIGVNKCTYRKCAVKWSSRDGAATWRRQLWDEKLPFGRHPWHHSALYTSTDAQMS